MSSNIDNGPTAELNNPPITPQYYQPNLFFITAITRGRSTVVTLASITSFPTTIAANLVIGQEVRFLIPPTYGIRQLNEMTGIVIDLPSATQVTVDIDSRLFDAFIPSPPQGNTRPQLVALGDYNSGQTNTGRTGNITYVPGSFINISPL